MVVRASATSDLYPLHASAPGDGGGEAGGGGAGGGASSAGHCGLQQIQMLVVLHAASPLCHEPPETLLRGMYVE